MAARGGVGVSSIPFEQRYRPPDPRRRRRESLSLGDRVVCATFGAVFGFLLWLLAYALILSALLKAAGRAARAGEVAADPFVALPPFWWGVGPSLALSLYGAARGAELLMDAVERVGGWLGAIARGVNRS